MTNVALVLTKALGEVERNHSKLSVHQQLSLALENVDFLQGYIHEIGKRSQSNKRDMARKVLNLSQPHQHAFPNCIYSGQM